MRLFPTGLIALVALLATATPGHAAPFSFTWTTTLGVSGTNYNDGEALVVTMVLDNGGTTATSQTWDINDLVSLTVALNDAPNVITTVFAGPAFSPPAPPPDDTTGSFVTDGTGALIAVPSDWGSRTGNFGTVVSTDDPNGSANIRWVLDGAGGFLYQNDGTPARPSNGAAGILPSSWVGPTAITFTVGGNLSGLSGGTVVLQNSGGDDLPLSANGVFTFATPVQDTLPYSVTVLTQPAGQTCTVTSGDGSVAGADVIDVVVTCSAVTFSVGGNLSGLSGGAVTLQNNSGDDLVLSANGAFSFATPVPDTSAYSITVLNQPAGQTCTVTDGTGTVSGADVTNPSVACSGSGVPTPSPTAEPVPALPWPALFVMVIGLVASARGGLRRIHAGSAG